MSEEPVADTPPSRVALRWLRSRLALALSVVSVLRVGAAFGVGLVAYVVFVVPDELAVLLAVSMAGAALVGLVPLVVVYAVVRAPV